MSKLGIVMAAAVLLAPVASQAQTQTVSTENLNLAKRLMATLGDTDAQRASVPQLARTMAHGFAAGAQEAGVPFNQKVLDRAVRAQIKTYSPQFVNATAKAYATVYTPEELRQFIAYYRKAEARRGKLPAPLLVKQTAFGEAQAANAAPLWTKMQTDLFGAYCKGAACTDKTRQVIAAYGHI